MLDKIKFFFHERKIKNQINIVFQKLYSNRKYETDDLIGSLNLRNAKDILTYYIVISNIAKLRRPCTESDITNIYHSQIKALQSFEESKKLQDGIIKISKLETELSMLNFNAYMEQLRRAYQSNENSPGGMLLLDLYAKGRPLSIEEEEKFKNEYEELNRLNNEIENEIKKEIM